jgi:hypothetical protein
MTMPPTPPSIDPDQVLPFPSITVVLHEDPPRVEISGVRHLLAGDDLDQLRENARLRMAKTAEALGRPVRAISHEPSGSWSLIVHPDGSVQQGAAIEEARKPRKLFRRRPR